MKTFLKFLSEFCVSPTIHVSWPNLAKIGLQKRHASGTLFSPLFRPHLADRAQIFVNVVDPWPVHVYRLWSGSAAVCRTYSGKCPKIAIQCYNKPTISNKLVMFSIVVSIPLSRTKEWRPHIALQSAANSVTLPATHPTYSYRLHYRHQQQPQLQVGTQRDS